MGQTCNIYLHRILIHVLALATGLLINQPTYSASMEIQADAGYLYDDNITRTFDGGGKLSDQSVYANLSLPVTFPISEHTRAIVTGSLGAETFLDHGELNNLSGKIQGVFQYRDSAEFGTPTWALFAKLGVVEYQSRQRDGWIYATGLSVQKTITDKIRIFGSVSHNERDGQNSVFKNKYDGVLVNLDYDIRSLGTMYLGGEYRDGDMAISAPWWDWYPTWAPSDITSDDAFSGWSYRVKGSTKILKVGFNLPLGQSSSLDFSWNMAESSATYWTTMGNPASNGSYTTNQYFAAWLTRF